MKNLETQLKKITDEIESLASSEVSLGELLDFGFLDKNADVGTLNELFKANDIAVKDIDDLEALDIKVLDKAVEKSTSFTTWDEMLKKAGEEYTLKRLSDAGFDFNN